VLGSSSPYALRTPEALAIMGPQCFGIRTPYQEIERLNGWT
jgi:hypothetical protein